MKSLNGSKHLPLKLAFFIISALHITGLNISNHRSGCWLKRGCLVPLETHDAEVGLIRQRLDANGTTLEYRWDLLGQLTELCNENNSTASFKYDPAGRLSQETSFDQQITDYLYDHGSNQPTRRIAGDRVTTFEYDLLGRLIARNAGHRKGKEWQTETFAYDGNGNLLLAENAACKLQWFYDRAGNNTRKHQYLPSPVAP